MKVRLFILFSTLFIIVGCTENDVSKVTLPGDLPDFVQDSDFESIDWERKAIEFGVEGMIGNKNKSGVIADNMSRSEGHKWMWHLWGVDQANLTVVGYHKETAKVHPILEHDWTTTISGENNEADSHTPSSVSVPKSGEWAILLYTDKTLFDILVLEIAE